MARTKLAYNPGEEFMIGFRPNIPVRVLSKSAGSNPNIWGIEVGGRRGYAPKDRLREERIFVKTDLLREVPTEPFMSVEPELNEVNDTDSVADKAVSNETPSSTENTVDSTTADKKIGDDKSKAEDTENTEQIDQIQNPSAEQTPTNEIESEKSAQPPKEIREHDDDDDEDNEGNADVDENKEVVENTVEELNSETPPQIDDKEQAETAAVKTDEVAEEVKSKTQENEDKAVKSNEEVIEKVEEKNEFNSASTILEENQRQNQLQSTENDSENAGREPVDEPLFVKKEAYQTGEIDKEKPNNIEPLDDADVKLEIVGITDNQENEKLNAVLRQDAIELNEVDLVLEAVESEKSPIEMPTDEKEFKLNHVDVKPTDEKLAVAENNDENEAKETKEVKDSVPLAPESSENMSTENSLLPHEVTEPIVPSVEQQPTNDKQENGDSKETDVDQQEKQLTDSISNGESEYLLLDINLPKVSEVDNMISSNESPDNNQHENTLSDAPKPVVQSSTESTDIFSSSEINTESIFAATETPTLQQNDLNLERTLTDDPIAQTTTESSIFMPSLPMFKASSIISSKIKSVGAVDDVPTENPEVEAYNQRIKNSFTEKSVEDNVNEKLESSNGQDISEGNVGAWISDVLSSLNLISDTPNNDAGASSSAFDSAPQGHCEKLENGKCPGEGSKSIHAHIQDLDFVGTFNALKDIEYERFANRFVQKMLEMAKMIVVLLLTTATTIILTFGFYVLGKYRREEPLILQINELERRLLIAEKESNSIAAELNQTRLKLTSIEDNSFGSNDMVIDLKHQLEVNELQKIELQEQIINLEKELETAAEAGLELNKMVSELLNNQSGSDSIISSVEELQRQLNEQEEMTLSINNLLAEKSRENSELQVLLIEKTQRFEHDYEELQKQIDWLKMEKENSEAELREKVHSLETRLQRDVEKKSAEAAKAKKELAELKSKYEPLLAKYRQSEARADSLEDTLKKLKLDGGSDDIKSVIEATNANAKILALTREKKALNEKLEGESDARKMLEDHVNVINEEIAKLRNEYSQAEKEKLEAQTRLEVLANYFKEKETQLQQ